MLLVWLSSRTASRAWLLSKIELRLSRTEIPSTVGKDSQAARMAASRW